MASQPQRAEVKDRAPIAGEAFLRALADHGIDYFFANPGTDFAPVVEAFSRAKQSNAKVPTPLVIPHENLAVAMAHGAYLMTGRPQAVMLHVNVGTANAINNIINLNRDNVPLILAAGGTPITEKGKFGSRNRYIHWAQEMFDQAGMLREAVKWDYELRVPEQVGDVVSRAYEVTMTSPRGPVYLVLPREPLAAPLSEPIGPVKPRSIPAPPHPDPQRIATLAEWIAAAEKPLIIVTTVAEGRGRAARKACREIRDPGRHAATAHRVPAVEPSDAHGLRSAGLHPGGRPRRSSSRPTCPTSPASSSRSPIASSPPSARTRCSPAIRCGASRAISPSRRPRPARSKRSKPRSQSSASTTRASTPAASVLPTTGRSGPSSLPRSRRRPPATRSRPPISAA